MKQVHVAVTLALMILLCADLPSHAQPTVVMNTNVAVPPLVNFSGGLADVNGKPLKGARNTLVEAGTTGGGAAGRDRAQRRVHRLVRGLHQRPLDHGGILPTRSLRPIEHELCGAVAHASKPEVNQE